MNRGIMKVTLRPTSVIDTIEGTVRARIWEGESEGGVPVKAWIALIQPQTDDPVLLAELARQLKETPASRNLVSFDISLAI